jgi:hypothetical protein
VLARPAAGLPLATAACVDKRKGKQEGIEMGKKKGKWNLTEHAPVGKGKEQRRQDKGEERRRTDGIPQGLIRNYRKWQGPGCKTKISR